MPIYSIKKYKRFFTVKEWKRFDKVCPADNDIQFINFFTGKKESMTHYTYQEVLLAKYKVFLTDYNTKKKWRKVRYPGERFYHFEKLPLEAPPSKKEKAVKILKSINFENFDKRMAAFDKGMQDFGKSMDTLTAELNTTKQKDRSKQDKANLKKLVGTTGPKVKLVSDYKPKVKIWGDKKTTKKSSKKKHKDNTQIWSKKKTRLF